ncbi:MAG: pyridoxal-phosphate dependent enzyme [Saprospirales bacterium]|nr:MAG: pyridoxal-phosphate dependent enzyme [Saprospirales bacterium]
MEFIEILECHRRIEPFVHRSPVMRSRQLNALSGIDLFFKCENFQKAGSFKIRGATNALLSLPEEKRKRGVVTHSSGNFAQALALAARNLGVSAYIAMPENAPLVKREAAKDYGGAIQLCGPGIKNREKAAQVILDKTGAELLHPSNDIRVIQGQGTAGLELFQDVGELDAVYVPVGGGGLIAGVLLAARLAGGNCRVIGAEPEMADDAYRSLQIGEIQYNEKPPKTIADGLKTHLGDVNFPIIKKWASGITTVSENQIIQAMKLIYERMKLVVEPSAAVALAAALKDRDKWTGKRVGIILSGGNVNPSILPF